MVFDGHFFLIALFSITRVKIIRTDIDGTSRSSPSDSETDPSVSALIFNAPCLSWKVYRLVIYNNAANKTQQPPSVVNPHLSSITGVLDVTKIFTQSQESFINMSEPEAISPSDAEMSDKSTGKTVSDASDAADASFAPSTPTMMVDEVAVSVNEITDPSVAYSSSGGQNEVDYSPPFDYIIVFTPKKTNKQFFHQMLTFDAAEMDADRLMSRMRSSSNLRNTFVSILRLAGLNVKQSEYRQGGLLVIKLGASEDTLMRLAEETQLPKRTLDGWWEPYSVMNADSFELTKFNTRFHARERQHL